MAVFWKLLAALGEKIVPIWMQDNAKNWPKLEIVCSDKTYQKPMYAFGFSNLLVLGVRKIEQWQQDMFKMRLRDMRRLPTRQNGGSGLPKELPRLSPKVTMDIGGTSFGRLRGGSYPN